MGGVFVNYRQNRQIVRDGRGDLELCGHAQLVEAIADRLARHFGQDVVFLDTELRLAARYPDELRQRLRTSDVVVAVIHEDWHEDLRDDLDWVQDELEQAIKSGIPVLPVRLNGVGVLKPEHLPPALKELAMYQSHEVRFAHWRRDMQRLIQSIEPHVEIAAVQDMEPPPVPAPHAWAPLLTAGAVGFATPFLATMALLTSLADRTVWQTALAIVLLADLAVVYGTAGLVYLGRRVLDNLDAASARQPVSEKTNVVIGLTVAGLGVTVLLTDDLMTPEMRIFALAVTAGAVVTLGSQWVLNRENATRWPQARLAAHPAAIRAAIARVGKHLDQCQAPLSRSERDQASFALEQITVSLALLRDLGSMNWRSWLRVSSLWRTCAHALCFGATAGAAVGALATYWADGGTSWQAPAWAAACLFLAVAGYLAAIDRTYALQQWRRRVVIETAPQDVEMLSRRLLDMSVPPAKENPAS